MSVAKIAITIPQETLQRAKKIVRSGRVRSLSTFLSLAAKEKLERDMLQETLEVMTKQHGPVPKDAQRWARKLLSK